jgi:hypothetical protein
VSFWVWIPMCTWTQKHGQSYFGYKVSVSADRRYKLIRRVKVSTASENDTLHLEAVLDHANTGRDLYGDKGYVDGGREHRLKAQGWRVHIQRKAEKGKPLSICQERRNTRIARVRARVNTSSPPWSRWAGNGCGVSAWIERPSNSRGRQRSTTYVACAVSRHAVWSLSNAQGRSRYDRDGDFGRG